MLKLSRYNYYFETSNGQICIFNLITKRIESFSKNNFLISNNESKTTIKLAETDYPSSMYSSGIILDNEIDEMSFVMNQYSAKVLICNPEYFALTVISTLRCNFNCYYCYEHKSNNQEKIMDMPENIYNNFLSFIHITTESIRKLHINFYGGEPLINKENFISMVSAIKSICAQNECLLSIAIITNGYNLDSKLTDFLFDLGIKVHIQITLDGPKSIHDKKRILHNGSGTFDAIIGNLKYLKMKNEIKSTFEVNLRVNVNANDHETFYELCHFLQAENLFDDFQMYAATIFDEDKCVCNDVNKNDSFDDIKYQLNNHVAKLKGKEYESSCKTLFTNHQLCTQLMRNAFLITPSGEIYKCYMDITDPNRCVGNISEIYKLRSNKTYQEILAKSKLDVLMCQECQALPLCITYCPRDTIVKNICHCYKDLIRHELDVYVKHSNHLGGNIINHIGFLD